VSPRAYDEATGMRARRSVGAGGISKMARERCRDYVQRNDCTRRVHCAARETRRSLRVSIYRQGQRHAPGITTCVPRRLQRSAWLPSRPMKRPRAFGWSALRLATRDRASQTAMKHRLCNNASFGGLRPRMRGCPADLDVISVLSPPPAHPGLTDPLYARLNP
jgi:hypothetical protein